MKNRHLSEKEIQLQVTAHLKLSEELTAHLASCVTCQAERNAYELIFTGIKNLERPAFDLDLSALVLEKIPAVKPVSPWKTYLAAGAATVFLAIAFITCSSYLILIFKALPAIYLGVIAAAALLVFLFQGCEAVKTYREKISQLNNHHFLQ